MVTGDWEPGEGIIVLVGSLLFGQSPSHPSQTREQMMPSADRIREQNEQDPGRVAHARQEAGSGDFLAVGPALCILASAQRGGSLFSQAFHHPGHNRDTTSTPSASRNSMLTPIVQTVFLLAALAK